MEKNNYKSGEIGLGFKIQGFINELEESSLITTINEIAGPGDVEFETAPDGKNTLVRVSFVPVEPGIPNKIFENLQNQGYAIITRQPQK